MINFLESYYGVRQIVKINIIRKLKLLCQNIISLIGESHGITEAKIGN